MRILVISRNPWDDRNSIGNTLSNFFSGIEGVEFASIYFREPKPSNILCKHYFQTSEIDILKRWTSPEKIGRRFSVGLEKGHGDQTQSGKNEKKIIHLIRKFGLSCVYKLSDRIWYSRKWINGRLRSFVEDFSPDLVFTFVKSAPQYYLTIRYLREEFGIPVLSWIADDEYTGLYRKNKNEEIGNLRYILRESAVVRGCSQEICDYYNGLFGCNATPLYKGCDLATPVKTTVNQPVRLVYAGNLLYGRLAILKQIADVLDTYGVGEKQAVLDIYSNTLLSAQDERFFGEKSCARYLGQRDYEAIKRELASADVVLHVESFEADQLLKTRYSFSTKIIDGLQSGSVLLAIGPEEQASIRYIRTIPGACVIHDPCKLEEELKTFLANAPSFCSKAEEIRAFAWQNHDGTANAKQLRETIEKIIEGEN